MQHRFETKAACKNCKATGIYQGFAERDGFGVQCHSCKGTGEVTLSIEWDDFTERQPIEDVQRVLQTNLGIGLGTSADKGLTHESFGGMPYSEWSSGKPFPAGSEMRRNTCPAWWYQKADYDLKPDWDECLGTGSFPSCTHFSSKSKCWERFDNELAERVR